jgi:hypothetical protein
LPFPVAPDVTVIQESDVAAVHAHPVAAETVTVAEAALAPSAALTGDTLNVHAAASWETVKARPAIVTVPVRAAVPGLAATEYPTVPAPVPLAPDVTVIHDAPLDAVHGHPLMAVTDTLPVVALADTDVALGLIAYVQPGLCVTGNVRPAMVNVADRDVVDALAATEYETAPLPAPFAPAVTVSHDALLEAVQAQPVAAVTLTLPVPAVPPSDTLVGEIAALQGEEKEKVFDSVLRAVIVWPTAATRPSDTVPAGGQGVSSDVKSTRIFPSDCGAGLPRFSVRAGWDEPTR